MELHSNSGVAPNSAGKEDFAEYQEEHAPRDLNPNTPGNFGLVVQAHQDFDWKGVSVAEVKRIR